MKQVVCKVLLNLHGIFSVDHPFARSSSQVGICIYRGISPSELEVFGFESSSFGQT